MKFFLAPSKTMTETEPTQPLSEPLFQHDAKTIRTLLQAYPAARLQAGFKLSDKQLAQVQAYYASTHVSAAIELYQGSVFQQLALSTYTSEQRTYFQNHVLILSAVYGMLRPFDGVQPYRLDLKQPVPELGESLTKYWQARLQPLLQDECCISFASQEFQKVLPPQTITLDFVESWVGNKPKRLATYAKIARGQLLNACVIAAVTSAEEIQHLETERYRFDPERSTPTHYVFSKKAESN